VKVGLRVLVGVGSGARAISELTEQPKVTVIATKGRINNRIDFACTKRNLPFVRLNAGHYIILRWKDQKGPVNGQASAFSYRPTGRGLYKSGWVCYDIGGRSNIGERDGFVKAGFRGFSLTAPSIR
jgi:hypothetical protein